MKIFAYANDAIYGTQQFLFELGGPKTGALYDLRHKIIEPCKLQEESSTSCEADWMSQGEAPLGCTQAGSHFCAPEIVEYFICKANNLASESVQCVQGKINALNDDDHSGYTYLLIVAGVLCAGGLLAAGCYGAAKGYSFFKHKGYQDIDQQEQSNAKNTVALEV